MDKESLELLLARGLSVAEIARRFGRHPSTVAYWMKKYGLVANHAERHSARGPIARERLAELVDAGMSITDIALAVDRSKATVRHWLGRYELRTVNAEARREFRGAKEAGLAAVTMRCRRHGETEFGIEGSGYYRCKRCRSESVARHRRRLKEMLVAEAGGSCAVCGYGRYLGALEFHHLDPDEKRLTISQNGAALSLEALRDEARKCVLVCSNCHAEIESGVIAIPARVGDDARQHEIH